MKQFTRLLSALVLGLCGCSKATHPLAKFARRLDAADHIVVTNRFMSFRTVVSGAEVNELASAVGSATKKLTTPIFCDWDAEFFAGTNHLGGIRLSGSRIMVGGIEYIDGTGVISAFSERLEKDKNH